MSVTKTRLRRLRLVALGLGALVAAFGGLVMSMLPESSGAAPTAAPVNTAEPSIRGTPRVGARLTSTLGRWTGTEPITFGRRWVRCPADGGSPDGANCQAIADATGRRYDVRQADVGFRLRVRVTATNVDGSTTVASNATATVAAPPARPTNTTEPSISGTPVVGNRLSGNRGSWTGDSPITFSYRWLRCSASGASCTEIGGATGTEYTLVAADVGRTLRFRVTARNSAGSSSALSNQTAIVQQTGSPPSSFVPVENLRATGDRLIVSQVRFSPNPVQDRVTPLTVQIRVTDQRGRAVRGALVFVRSVPRRTTGGDRQPTGSDGWVTYQLQKLRHFPAVNGNVQFFVKAYRAGDPPLGGLAGYRLVQVRVLTAGES
jgi:hypothetical protein